MHLVALSLDKVIDLALSGVPPGTVPAVLCRSTATQTITHEWDRVGDPLSGRTPEALRPVVVTGL
jgi:hypothetical protein